MSEHRELSDNNRLVLQAIAEGQSYAQIVDGGHGLTYRDIFAAAEEALALLEQESDYQVRMAAIKEKHPRAYERWEPEEDEALRRLNGEGHHIEEIAEVLQRQPGAIRSRLDRLGLPSDPPVEVKPKFSGEHPRSGKVWTKEEEGEAKRLYKVERLRISAIAERLQRTPFAVEVRLKQLGVDVEETT